MQATRRTVYSLVDIDEKALAALLEVLSEITRVEATPAVTALRDEFTLSSEDWIQLNALHAVIGQALR
jgi:hypothetical protein